MSDVPSRRLATFTGAGYDKGRPLVVQAVWFAVMNVIFMAWWCPARLRPALLRAFGATVGEGVFIRHRVRVLWPWKLTVGNDVWIGEDVWLLNLEPITLADDVCLSQGAYLCTGSHDWRASDFRYDNAPITLEAGVWVATRATVLRGVTVGRDAVIGAQALVTRDVPAAAIVPAATKH